MTRLNHVKKARKSYKADGIKKGDSYYWWKFRFGAKHRSLNKPSRSALTRSGFLSSVWSLEDGFSMDRDSPETSIEDLKSEIENLGEECESSLENMPEHLQESSSSGELLQERIDLLEEWVDELDSIDFDVDEGSIKEEATGEVDAKGKSKSDVKDKIQKLVTEKKSERLDEIDAEINDTFGKF